MFRTRSLYLVCYDITSNARRRAIRKRLTAHRVGGQRSALECLFTPAEFRDALADLEELMDPGADRVQVIRLDPRAPVEGWGLARVHRVGEPLLVI